MKLPAVLVLLLLSVGVTAAEKAEPVQIVTAHPAVHMLAEYLLQDTSAQLMYLPSQRLPVKRVPNWIKRNSGERLKAIGPVTAFITVESVWPQFALYGRLRAENIAVIPIDAATELNEPGGRIKRSTRGTEEGHYFWLAPDNLLVMSGIMASDLSRLLPNDSEKIKHTHLQLRTLLQRSSAEVEEQIMAAEVDEICLLSPELLPLAEALYLPVEEAENCAEHGLKLGKQSRKLQAAANVWAVDAVEKLPKGDVAFWLDQNLKALMTALK